ncbi:hypothetical protein GWK47_008076 [Chionoecetes opilio]|uniref:Uncharacterized protein n=1 Tax=Chionoecetes opilio TaxID=41210 RepID=A0A8J4XY89_CHIOP|nr:hypothetical protein GWK47_008076 [Chionoecetes opilio]
MRRHNEERRRVADEEETVLDAAETGSVGSIDRDDIVLIIENENDLQKLDGVCDVCRSWKLRMNGDKSKIPSQVKGEDVNAVNARFVVGVVVLVRVQMERPGPLLLMMAGLLLLMRAGTLQPMKVWAVRRIGIQLVKIGTVSQPQDELLRSALQATRLVVVGEGEEAMGMVLLAGREHFLEGGLPATRVCRRVSLLGGVRLHSPESLLQQL